MKILFTELSEAELLDTMAYYELEHKGLGAQFKNEVKSAIKKITHFPEAYAIERGDVRRYLMHKFPYKILYSIETEHLLIIAIAHLHRKPDYWVEKQENQL